MSHASARSRRPTATLIVPCAGAGSRFNAPYAKELHRVGRGSLIDEALAPFLAWSRETSERLRLVVPVSEDRGPTLRHLHAYREDAEVVLVFQQDRADGLVGAVEAALPHAVGPTTLVLPDQFFAWSPDDNPVASLAEVWNERTGALTAALDTSELVDEGAVRLGADDGSGHVVVAAAESPGPDAGRYDAAWVAISCPAGSRHLLVDVAAGRRDSPLVGARAVPVRGYVNASTPEAVR